MFGKRLRKLEGRVARIQKQFTCFHQGEHDFTYGRFNGGYEKCVVCNKIIELFDTHKEMIQAKLDYTTNRYVADRDGIRQELDGL